MLFRSARLRWTVDIVRLLGRWQISNGASFGIWLQEQYIRSHVLLNYEIFLKTRSVHWSIRPGGHVPVRCPEGTPKIHRIQKMTNGLKQNYRVWARDRHFCSKSRRKCANQVTPLWTLCEQNWERNFGCRRLKETLGNSITNIASGFGLQPPPNSSILATVYRSSVGVTVPDWTRA